MRNRKSPFTGHPVICFGRILCFIVTALAAGQGAVSGQTASVIAKNTFPSVAVIETWDENGVAKSFGSGFVVRPGIVVTNYHVIKGAARVSVHQVDNGILYQAGGIVGIDSVNDLALIAVPGFPGKPLPLATDLSKLDVGQDVYALGNPRGLEGTISPGIISSQPRNTGKKILIQITAPVSQGSSGGPVVDNLGQVIGVATSSLESGQNLNFVVPSVYIGILQQASTQPISFAAFLESELPSAEELASWLTRSLSGRDFRARSGHSITSDRKIQFYGCSFEYSAVSELRTATEVFPISSKVVGSLANLKTTGHPRVTPTVKDLIGPEAVFLPFNEKSIEEMETWSTLPQKNTHRKENSVTFFVSDKKLVNRVENAFRRLGNVCRGVTASPPFAGEGVGSHQKKLDRWGDPNGRFAGFSNGSGSGVGQGSGRGTGFGSGSPYESQPLRIITKPRPEYTPAARQANIQGGVVLQVTFLASGEIGAIWPVVGLSEGLTGQAIAAARRMTFTPAKKDGIAQTITRQIEYSFTVY